MRSKGKKDNADLIEKLFDDDALAKKFKNILEGKPNPEDIISPQAATALKTYLNFSTSVYKDLKKFTDSIGRPFLPAYYIVAKDCDDCLPNEEELKFEDDCATATIKGTCDKFMQRILQDSNTEEVMVRMVQEYMEDFCFI